MTWPRSPVPSATVAASATTAGQQRPSTVAPEAPGDPTSAELDDVGAAVATARSSSSTASERPEREHRALALPAPTAAGGHPPPASGSELSEATSGQLPPADLVRAPGPASRAMADSVTTPTPGAPTPTPGAHQASAQTASDVAPARPEPSAPAPAASGPESVVLTVRSGDSLDRLFRRHDLSVTDLHAMLALEQASRGLKLIRPGDEVLIRRDGKRVLSLTRRLDDFHVLGIERGDQGDFHATIEEELPERRVVHASGRIDSSLFNAGRAAGISDTLVMELAGIFAWDIDFVLDIRQGDEFTVLYEELWRDGSKLRDGKILAAEFVNTGHRYQAIRYVDPGGEADYFTPEGLSMRKAFLRAPVDFTRISSNFNPRRRHPVLNTIRAHRGVDYAAPPGTPIKAAGDGKVSFRGVKGGYGNVVILQHGDNITTLYAHMSRFGRYRQGARVRQGDVIGYVGATGRVTGPHLHYEYRIAGVHRNPRTVDLPQARPVAGDYRSDFLTHAEHVLSQLALVKSLRLAAAH
jgi:murein DD-endopeptidase MepM/ murein hydrolase activator NlpD